MTRRLRALVIAGLAAGILAGAIIAVAVPRTRDSAARIVAMTPGPVMPVRVGPAVAQPKGGGYILLRARPKTVRLEALTPDSRGGPPWVLRVFEAQRVVPKTSRRPGVNPVIGRNLCAQLGRLYRGRFGWIDAKATFRPVGVGFRGAPSSCGSRRTDMGRKPLVSFESLITDPAGRSPRVFQTILWGLAGSDGRSVDARIAQRRAQRKLSPRGGFLIPGPSAARENETSLKFRYATGSPERIELGRPHQPPFFGRPVRGHPIGPAQIEARAPDPNGGLPWGVAATRSREGGWCVTRAGRIVGDRIGQPDTALGTVREIWPSASDCPAGQETLTRSRPVSMGSTFGGGDPRPGPQRRARRTLAGLTVLNGTARADVKTVTIATPRDLRTLVPSSRAHAFVVVYDGTFPTGVLSVTATFKDGTTHVDRFPAGP